MKRVTQTTDNSKNIDKWTTAKDEHTHATNLILDMKFLSEMSSLQFCLKFKQWMRNYNDLVMKMVATLS